jgi:hypothetical protein
MAIDPKILLEISKNAQIEWYKNEIPISSDERRRYKCANPEGPVENSGCPEDDPFCNCPEETLNLQPKDAFLEVLKTGEERFVVKDSNNEILSSFKTQEDAKEFIDGLQTSSEPTEEELEELLENSKYCTLIEQELGPEYLGCDWDEPDSRFSCSCPSLGEKYTDWKKYSRTYSTFWNTPKQTPLLRNAQMTLLTAQKAEAVVQGDLSIRPGAIINMEVSKESIAGDVSLKSSSGRWMVAEIEHLFLGANSHGMKLTLIRDSLYVDPNSSESE